MVTRGDLLTLGAVGALALAGARGSRAKRLPNKVLPPEKRGQISERILPEGTPLSMHFCRLQQSERNIKFSKPYLWKNSGGVPVHAYTQEGEDLIRRLTPDFAEHLARVRLPREAKFIFVGPECDPVSPSSGAKVFESLTGQPFLPNHDRFFQLSAAARSAGYDGLVFTERIIGLEIEFFSIFDYLNLPQVRRTIAGERLVALPGAEPW